MEKERARGGTGAEPDLLLSLLLAIETGQPLEAIRLIIEQGADPKRVHPCKADSGETVLHKAVARNRLDAVELLIPLSDLDARDAEGASALLLAAELGRTAIAKALLPVSDSSLRNLRGDTALSVALRSRRHELMAELLPTLIPGQADARGDTPLMAALEAGATPALIHALIDAGSDPCQLNAKGQSALSIAVRLAMVEQAQALLSRMPSMAREDLLNQALSDSALRPDGHEPKRELIARFAAALSQRESLESETAAYGAGPRNAGLRL